MATLLQLFLLCLTMHFLECIQQAPVNIISHTSDVEASAGANFTLECTATGTPTPTVMWKKNGQNYTQAQAAGRSVVTITGANEDDTGTFTCQAENGLRNSEGKLIVDAVNITVSVNFTFGKVQLKADVAFIIDSSGSIGRRSWDRLKQFLRHLVGEMNVGPNDTHVAAVTYSFNATVEFKFNTVTGSAVSTETYSELFDEMKWQKGLTFIDRGIQLAQREIFTTEGGMRDNAQKIAIVITDGQQTRNSGSFTEPQIAAKGLKDIGVHVYSIGIGNGVDKQELRGIATNGDQDVFTINNFQHLKHLISGVVNTFYQTRPVRKVICQSTVNVTVKRSGSTSIRVKWIPVLLNPLCGHLMGYRILYKISTQRGRRSLEESNAQKVSAGSYIQETNSSDSSAELQGLNKFTEYCIQVVVRTTKRDLAPSSCKYVRTDGDVPSRAPQWMVSPNNITPFSITVQLYEVPKQYLHGELMGYQIVYTAARIGQREVANPETFEVIVNSSSTSMTLHGLQQYVTYCVKVAAITRKGSGPFSSSTCLETCRCKDTLYVDKRSLQGSTFISENVLIQLFRKVCSSCESYDAISLIITADTENTDISFTTKTYVPSGRNRDTQDSFASLWKVPGVAVVKRRDAKSIYPSLLREAVLSSWPISFIVVLLAFLAGSIFWILEVRHNTDLFPRRILGGQGEGVWWSIISMSTVGYGDRVPVTALGRVFAIIWFLVSVVLVSFYIAALTASLIVTIIRLKIGNSEDIHRVAVVANSVEEMVAIRSLRGRIEIENYYNSTEDLIYALKTLNEDILVDMYLPRKREELWNDHNLEIIFVPGIFVQGLRLQGHAARLADDIQKFARKENLQTKLLLGRYENKTEEEKQEIETAIKEKETTINFFDPSNKYFQLTLHTCGAMLFFACCCGLVYECLQRRRVSRRFSHEVPHTEHQRKVTIDEYRSKKAELSDVVEDFYVRSLAIITKHKAACLKQIKVFDQQMQTVKEESTM